MFRFLTKMMFSSTNQIDEKNILNFNEYIDC